MRIFRFWRYQYLKILRLKDAPSKIANGVALGLALDFLPIPFISLFVSWIIARILGFNAVAAVATAAAFKPAVFTIFYPMNILVGRLFIDHKVDITKQPQVPIKEPELSVDSLSNFFSLDTLSGLGTPFLIGSAFNGIVCFFLISYIVKRALEYRQAKRMAKMKNKNEKENE